MWHVINGKALATGINLRTMESSDMLDIVHYYYETDMVPLHEGHAKSLSDVRVAMWKHIYNKDYPYKWVDPDAPKDFSEVSSDSMDPEFEHKPYVPPTDPSEFADILDAPMGG